MFESQASYTFNPLLPFTPHVSDQFFSFDDIPSFAGDKILQRVNDFIAPSYYSSSSLFKTAHLSLTSLSKGHLQEDTGILALSVYDSLEDTVSRLLGQYWCLYTIMKNTKAKTNGMLIGELDFVLKVYILHQINRFGWYTLNILNRLATLTLEYSQESLLNHFRRLFTALTSLDSFKIVLRAHNFHNIQELVITAFNRPLTQENLLYTSYIINCASYPSLMTEKLVKSCKILSIKCPTPKDPAAATSTDIMDLIRSKKAMSCLEEDNEELERHERSSTTSASSRTNSGEVDAPLTFAGFENSPHSKQIESSSKYRDMTEMNGWQELYDGCFFGDLTITFSSTDKLLFQNDEEINNYQSRRKLHHNKYNYPKTSTFNGINQLRQNFSPIAEENVWKGKSIFSDPNFKTTQQEQKIIPLNLFTLPTGAFLPNAGFNMFNPGNIVVASPAQSIIASSFQNKDNTDMIKNLQTPCQNSSEQKIRNVSHESQSIFLSDKKKKANNASVVSTPQNPKASQKNPNIEPQSSKKTYSGKKSNSKKNQDKGGFKLWDMISIQGKLKNF